MKKNKNKIINITVPAATVVIYIGTAIVILGICAVVFFIGFNELNGSIDNSSLVSESSLSAEL